MRKKTPLWKQNLKASFGREKTICRILAAWCTFAMFQTFREGSFADLAFAQDVSFGGMLLAMMAAFALFTVVAVLLPHFETDSWFLLASATVCVLQWLSDYRGDKNGFLVAMAIIVAYALFLVYFLYRNTELLDRFHLSKRAVWILSLGCGVLGGTIIAVTTCLRYMTFSSPNYDFGLFCQMFHYMKETGLPLITSERDQLLSHFAVHISPIYYVLLPFYLIFPSPLTLQIGQAVVLASGVIPVMLLARHFKLSGPMQLLMSFIYACYPAVSCGCFYDIHENCFLAPLLLWMFYFFEKDRHYLMFLFALLVLFVKEDAAVYVILFALYVLLSRKKYVRGTCLIVGSLAYFGLALHLLTKYGEGVMVNRFDNLIFDKDAGLLGAVKTAFVNPGFLLTQLFTTRGDNWDKIVYFLQMFLPLGLLPFCTKKPGRWLLMTPILMNLLTYYQYQYNIGFQYNFGITAFLVYAAIQNLPDLKMPTRRNLAALGAAACLGLYILAVPPKMNRYVDNWKNGQEKYRQMEEILDTLPEDASLNVSTMLLAHVSDHDILYELNYHKDQPDVDYVVIDARYMDQKAKAHKAAYLAHGYTVLEDHKGLILILQKPAEVSGETP